MRPCRRSSASRSSAKAIAGESFQKRWAGRTAWDLFGVMTATMPVGGAGTLSPQQYADLLAYLFELNTYPAGAQELTPDRAGLELWRFR